MPLPTLSLRFTQCIHSAGRPANGIVSRQCREEVHDGQLGEHGRLNPLMNPF